MFHLGIWTLFGFVFTSSFSPRLPLTLIFSSSSSSTADSSICTSLSSYSSSSATLELTQPLSLVILDGGGISGHGIWSTEYGWLWTVFMGCLIFAVGIYFIILRLFILIHIIRNRISCLKNTFFKIQIKFVVIRIYDYLIYFKLNLLLKMKQFIFKGKNI